MRGVMALAILVTVVLCFRTTTTYQPEGFHFVAATPSTPFGALHTPDRVYLTGAGAIELSAPINVRWSLLKGTYLQNEGGRMTVIGATSP